MCPIWQRTSLTVCWQWTQVRGCQLDRPSSTRGSSAWLHRLPWRTCSAPSPRTSWRGRRRAATAPSQPSPHSPAVPLSPARHGGLGRKSSASSTAATSNSTTVEPKVSVWANPGTEPTRGNSAGVGRGGFDWPGERTEGLGTIGVTVCVCTLMFHWGWIRAVFLHLLSSYCLEHRAKQAKEEKEKMRLLCSCDCSVRVLLFFFLFFYMVCHFLLCLFFLIYLLLLSLSSSWSH